jgi:hypothetical protein
MPTSWQGSQPPDNFIAHSSQEIRTHNEVLSPQEDVLEWKSNAWLGNAMFAAYQFGTTAQQVSNNIADGQLLNNMFLGANQVLIPTYNTLRLFTGFESIWRGIVTATNSNLLKVCGMKTVNSSPFGYNNLGTQIFELLEALSDIGDPAAVTAQALDVFFPILLYTAGGPNLYAFAAANSFGLSVSVQPVGLGLTLSSSTGGGLLLPSISYVNSFGTQGSVTRQAARTGYSVGQFLNRASDHNEVTSSVLNGRSRRMVTRREVEGTDAQRVRGGEVLWQGKLLDIVAGTIPLDFTLPATSGKMHYRTSDDALRIRFGGGVGRSLVVDFWFDVIEEVIRDDY